MASTPVDWIDTVSSRHSRRIAALATPAAAAALVLTATPAHAETLSPGQLAGIVSSAGLPCVTGTAVALAESGGNTYATGAAGEQGLFQIHPVHGQSGMYDPHANAAYAAQLFASQGWSPWAAHSNGSYTRYLSEAYAACSGSTPAYQPAPTSSGGGSSSGYDGTCSRDELFWEDCDPADLPDRSEPEPRGSGKPVLYYKAGVAIKDLDSDGDGDPARCGPPALLMYERCD